MVKMSREQPIAALAKALPGTKLVGLDLSGLNLSSLNAQQAQIPVANLSGTNLIGANLNRGRSCFFQFKPCQSQQRDAGRNSSGRRWVAGRNSERFTSKESPAEKSVSTSCRSQQRRLHRGRYDRRLSGIREPDERDTRRR